jgi:hypothetical protein
MMAYDQIVFIGYVIDTAPEKTPSGEVYLGLPDPALDIAARCQLMKGAIERARGLVAGLPPVPGETLYVFVAPEFLFRGATGAYSMRDVQLAIEGIQSIVADAKWKDWVFGFGTIIGQWLLSDSPPCIQICNFALVQQGGLAEQGADGARAIQKELKSGIDFIAKSQDENSLVLGAVSHQPADMPGPGREQQQAAYDGAGIFELAGINWAVEICLDHLVGRLQESPQMVGDAEVQVQIVPSCGASIDAGSTIAQRGGYIFNVDGYRTDAHASLLKVATPPVRLARAAKGAVNIDNVNLETSPPETVPVSNLYANGSGSISVSAPVPVPPPQTVTGSSGTYRWTAAWDALKNPTWIFTFYVNYDEEGHFTSALCKIWSRDRRFQDHKYTLPLWFDLSLQGGIGSIEINVVDGGFYHHAIRADIELPDFTFHGNLILFMTEENSPSQVQTVWRERGQADKAREIPAS